MKYTAEITEQLVKSYLEGSTVEKLASQLSVPSRSIIAKLSSLGVYQKKTYLTKQGEEPVKKSEYIERIAELLEVNLELLESLEKTNKNILKLIAERLPDPKSEQPGPSQDKSDQVE
jgi:predicted house-cleaning noncanonical NTP pyrophosphatase (MazG superfamily)